MKNTLKGILLAAVLGIVMLAAACGGNNANGNTGNNGSNEPPGGPEEEQTLDQAMESGEIVSIDGNRLIITAYIDQGDESYIDAYSLTVSDQTELLNAAGDAITIDDLQVGFQVEAWTVGPVAESYPMQADAGKLVLLDDAEDAEDRAEAVRIALEAQTELAGPWSVKEAAMDEEGPYWNVVLVHHQHIDQPVSVRVDVESGEIVPNVVAENEAFRVFSPEPNTIVDNVIAVEGEARVFEGAFSWTLEDGHAILDEGHATAEQGAPEWGSFSFEASFEYASQPNLMLILYTNSANDGSVQNELIIPLQVEQDLIQYPPQ